MDIELSVISLLIIIALVAGLVGFGLILILRRQGLAIDAKPPQELIELRGQLAQLTQAAQQQQKAHVEQMVALSQRLEESLSGMSVRMGNSLQEQTEKTHKNLSDLAARLAVIDAANTKIGELTGQVTQLHNILANKTDTCAQCISRSNRLT